MQKGQALGARPLLFLNLMCPSRFALRALPSLPLLLHRGPFDRIACCLPCIQTAEQCRRVIKSFCFEFEHRPGARMFGRSSAVSRNHLVAGQIRELGCERPCRHRDCPFDVFIFESRFRARIDD